MWGGIYGTLFWIDPVSRLIFGGMVQRTYYSLTEHAEFAGDAPNLVGMLQAAVYSGLQSER